MPNFNYLVPEKRFEDFTLYFLAFNHDGLQLSEEEKKRALLTREGARERFVSTRSMLIAYLSGILELTHNHGTESDPNFQGYASGNSDPGRGFGHIAITVDNIEQACERFERIGVPFKKKLSDGKMRHIAFMLDPDGYVSFLFSGRLSDVYSKATGLKSCLRLTNCESLHYLLAQTLCDR